MSTRRNVSDPMTVITALRPRPEEHPGWSQQEKDDLLTRLLKSPHPSPAPRPARYRRRVFTLALSGVLVVAGGGAAVAGGLMPQSFVDAFAYWRDQPDDSGRSSIDPSTAERVATAPGPDGTVFTVVTAHAADNPDFSCTTALFETPESAARPGPSVFTDAFGSFCAGQRDEYPGDYIGVSVTDGWSVWQAGAGEAVRGELTTASGKTWPVVLAEGSFWGWFPAPEAGAPQAELVGFAADGTEVGRTAI